MPRCAPPAAPATELPSHKSLSGCFAITTVFSHAQTVVLCGACTSVLCQPTGGKARLTEGASCTRFHHAHATQYFVSLQEAHTAGRTKLVVRRLYFPRGSIHLPAVALVHAVMTDPLVSLSSHVLTDIATGQGDCTPSRHGRAATPLPSLHVFATHSLGAFSI